MKIHAALRAGRRVRHRDWPPYHFAELRPSTGGEQRLYRLDPAGNATPLDVSLELLSEEEGWSILEERINRSDRGQ